MSNFSLVFLTFAGLYVTFVVKYCLYDQKGCTYRIDRHSIVLMFL